jgi:hypothetical protein
VDWKACSFSILTCKVLYASYGTARYGCQYRRSQEGCKRQDDQAGIEVIKASPMEINRKVQYLARNKEGSCCPNSITPGLLNSRREVDHEERVIGGIHVVVAFHGAYPLSSVE